MADLRIVDAPEIPTNSITGQEKLPTGGSGNYSITLDSVADYTKTKKDLADKNYVDLSSKGVKDSLDAHIADKANPHQVTKTQVGLGNVDNTADVDKPVSNATKSAITTATTDMATKAYVNNRDGDLTTLKTADKTNLVKAVNEIHDVSIKNGTYDPVLGSPVKLKLNPVKASLVYGISDPTHLDDNLNNFRGLRSQNAWDDSNIGTGGVAFGRNNVPFVYLSTAFGHDCVAYGVASVVGGAGSATGNPDVPSDGANYGYCSLAFGKDTIALGRISNAMGERNISASRYSSTDGYGCIAGAQTAQFAGDIESEGAAARAHGYKSEAYGSFSFSYGAFLKSFNGAQVLGRGINEGSTLNIRKMGLALGYNVDVPTIFCQEGPGVNGAHAWVGFNTEEPLTKYDYRLGKSDTVIHHIDAEASPDTLMAMEVKGLLLNGSYGSLHNLVISHPNGGQAYATADYYINGKTYLSIDQSLNAKFKGGVWSDNGFYVAGKHVIGGQLPAIADSSGTAADNQRAINAILAALRSHGLIAS